MPKQHFLKSFSIITSGFLIGYVGMNIYQNQFTHSEMNFSSLAGSEKSGSLPKLSKLSSESIYENYFDVRIKHIKIANNINDPSIVKAIIIAKTNIPSGLKYQWLNGVDVIIKEELTHGVLPELQAGEEKEIEIAVSGFSKALQTYLSFEIQGQIGSQEIKKTILSSSRLEDSFEYLVQQNAQKEKEEKLNSKSLKASATKKSKFDLSNIVK